jgi:uncharacterized protein (TIGR02757 family)
MSREQRIELILERTYEKYHHREYVSPDPLQFLYGYPDIRDREIVGLLASSLALGRVSSIIGIIESVLSRLPSPYESLMNYSEKELIQLFDSFKYRFYTRDDLISLLISIKKQIEQYGSLNGCFLRAYREEDQTVLPSLDSFVENLGTRSDLKMLSKPSKGSACKRMNLYLRWMIRSDNIDPGGWSGVAKSKLIIPLDTHIIKVSKMLKLTTRHDAGIKTALEITENLKKYDPEDPVRFDFSLTRPGIHPDLDYRDLTTGCGLI